MELPLDHMVRDFQAQALEIPAKRLGSFIRPFSSQVAALKRTIQALARWFADTSMWHRTYCIPLDRHAVEQIVDTGFFYREII
jgi:hypothetical protein